jgi:hypothetical protein
MSVAPFRARFALESFDDGAVLVDLESGTYFELNATAREACAALLHAADRRDAEARLGARLGTSAEEARSLIDAVLAELAGAPDAPATFAGPFRYSRHGDVYVLEDEGRPVLETRPRARELRLSAAATGLRFPMLEYVRAVTPKLLGLAGVTVFHAAACRWSGRSVAFAGASGAGKTTTMRAFVNAGADPIAEDLVLVAGDTRAPACHRGGEARARAWAQRTAERLERERAASVSFVDLADAASGETWPLDELWFIDSAGRRGDALATTKLGNAAGFLALLRNTFIGEADAVAWARHLGTVRDLADRLVLREASAPQGLAALAVGARRYVTNSAS